MSLIRFNANGFRNLDPLTLEPSAGLNYIVGPNASGKSSLLEAICLLGRARSFRTSHISHLIQTGEAELTIAGRVRGDDIRSVPIGIRISRSKREIHLDGKTLTSSSELFRTFPLLVIQPAGIALMEGPPKLRRQFLDFGAFHLDPSYLDQWRRYTKALNQRNSLLRHGRTKELTPWNHELSRYGIMIANARSRYVERLRPLFQNIGQRFFSDPNFDLRVQPGWDTSRPLSTILERDLGSDLRQGHTQSGPHKGDFSIHLNGKPVKAYLSRGQMKVLVYALLLSQSHVMEEQVGSSGCVLIDDVASELDDTNKNTLLDLLKDRITQYFITATDLKTIEQGMNRNETVFMVEKGRITQAKL